MNNLVRIFCLMAWLLSVAGYGMAQTKNEFFFISASNVETQSINITNDESALKASETNTVLFDAEKDNGEKGKTNINISKEGVNIHFSTGALSRGDYYRLGTNAKMTISSKVGNIVKVVFKGYTTGDKDNVASGPGHLAIYKDEGLGNGSYDYDTQSKIGTWTGDATSFQLIASNSKVILLKIEVTYRPSQSFILSDDSSSNVITPDTNATVSLTRSFNANAWNSLVLPFDLTAAQVKDVFGEQVKVADYVGTKSQADGTYTLDFKTTDVIRANVPVFVYGADNVEDKTIGGLTLVEGNPESVPNGAAFAFEGAYSSAQASAGDWFISSDNNFYKASGQESIKAMRAVFKPVERSSSAKRLMASFNGGAPTAIHSVSADAFITAPVYNMAGQRVGDGYKGVVIQQGHKFIRK